MKNSLFLVVMFSAVIISSTFKKEKHYHTHKEPIFYIYVENNVCGINASAKINYKQNNIYDAITKNTKFIVCRN